MFYLLEVQVDNYEDYLDLIPCRDEFKCNCIVLPKLDEELKMDDMLEKHTSNKLKVVKNMKQYVFLENNMDGDGNIMSMKVVEGSNNGKKCKEKVIATIESQRATGTNSKFDELKHVVSGVVTTVNAPTSSNPRKRRKVAYGSGQDYFYYT